MKQNIFSMLAFPLIISLTFFSCGRNEYRTFSTRYLSIGVDDKGYIRSMKNITVRPFREFSPIDKPSPLISLYDSDKRLYYYPEKATYHSFAKKMTLNFTNGSVAEIKILPQKKYFKFTLTSLEPRNGVDAIQWGSYHTNITNLFGEIIGVARDTSELVNYSIGLLALDDNTIGGTADLEGDAAPFQYVIHSPDPVVYPLPSHLREGQIFTLGGDGVSDVAFYAHKEPYYRILYGNAATIDANGRISVQYFSRDRTKRRNVYYSLIPNMAANTPNHIDIEPLDINFIGSSIALWGSPDSTALLDVIQDIVLSEGLPYPTVNGKWVKNPAAYVPDVICRGNLYDSIISYTSQLGFKSIHAYDRGFLRPDRGNEGYLDGRDFERKPFRFESGDKSHKEFADEAAKIGLMLGRVCITNSLAPRTKDVSPYPSDSLLSQQKRILMNDLSPEDTVILVNDPTYLDEIASWEGHCEELNMVKIGKELIHYLGVTDEAPYRLKNVTRGYWGTYPAQHNTRDTIYKLQVTLRYGYEGIIPNMALQDKIAEYYGDVAVINGVTFYDFDGQEFLFNNGHGYYSAKRFFRKMIERAQQQGVPYIRFTGATLSEGSWHYQSIWNVGGGKNLYDVDTREWGSATSQGKDLRDVTFSNYYPVSFGGNFAIRDTSTVEQYEHIQAIAIGFGATYCLPLSQRDVESCPQKEKIFTAIRTWEDARAADVFPSFIRKMLRNPEYDWTLAAGTDIDSWTLYRLVNGKKTESYHLKKSETQ